MTPQALYQKVLNEEMSQAQFLFQIRRDEGLSSFITNTNTYDQTITQLKNRGHIFDINEAKEETFDLLGSIKILTEATKKPKLDQDHANDYEFQQGWRYELDLMKEPDLEKAKAKTLKNMESDPIYYTRLLLLKTKKPTTRTDQPVEVNKGRTNVVDKINAIKPVKGIEKDKNTPKGSAEKATKPKGVKTMKGGQGDVKVVSESKEPFPGNKLKGGKGDKLSIKGVDRKELKKGIKHEMEHTTDPKIAAEIALDHLAENPKYYTELDKTGIDESIFSPSDDKPVKGKEVSFTVEDHTDPNKKLQIKKTVKSGKKSKDGSFELSFTEGDKITMSKTKQGVSSLYFENPGKPEAHDKVVDLDKGLATLADKLFPKEQEKAVNEDTVDESLSIKPRVYPFSLEKLKSLKQRGDEILHFNQGTYGRVTFLVNADVKNHYSAAKASSRDGKVAAHSLKTIAKAFRQSQEMIIDLRGIDVDKLAGEIDGAKDKPTESLREALKTIIRKKLYETEQPGPTVKKNELNDLMKRYEWYYETSENPSLKQRGQDTHDKAMLIVNDLGQTGVDVFNSYAPDDKKISVKDLDEDMAVNKYGKLSDVQDFDQSKLEKMFVYIDMNMTDEGSYTFKIDDVIYVARPTDDDSNLWAVYDSKDKMITKPTDNITTLTKNIKNIKKSDITENGYAGVTNSSKKKVIDILNKYDSDQDSKKGTDPIVDIIYWGKKQKGNNTGTHSFTTIRKSGKKFDQHSINRSQQDVFDELGDKLEKRS